MNDFDIEEIKKIVLNEKNSKEWYDLTLDEIEMIEDPEKRREYMKKVKFCIRYIINPLQSALNVRKINFPKETCKGILDTLTQLYKKRNMTKEDMKNIIMERYQKK